MSKIKTIKLTNFKAIGEFEADFNGCTAIITAGNDKGKTSFLKGIIDRIRFIRPGIMVKEGEQSGKGEMVLDSGEKFIWEFDIEGKDKLTYIDQNQVKQKVTVELGKSFFPPTFEIDKFLQSTPTEQIKQLQKIVGIDFTDVQERYLLAYNLRTSKNADAEKFHVKLSQMLKVPFVAPVNLDELQAKKEVERTRLNDLYKENKAGNEKLRNDYTEHKESVDKICCDNNNESTQREVQRAHLQVAVSTLKDSGYENDKDLFEWIDKKYPVIEKMDAIYDPEPEYKEEMPDDSKMREIDAQILEASQINVEAKKYSDYMEYKATTEAAKIEAEQADESVKLIEDERKKLIATANFPKGITIEGTGISVDGYPLDKDQISTSKLYTTALRIAAMNLGEVKSLYFDASYLDNKTLKEIEDWAEMNNLQLLIERPDREGGDIKYELIEN